MYNVFEETRNILIYLERIDKYLEDDNKEKIKFCVDMIKERIKYMIERANNDNKNEREKIEYIYELLGVK